MEAHKIHGSYGLAHSNWDTAKETAKSISDSSVELIETLYGRRGVVSKMQMKPNALVGSVRWSFIHLIYGSFQSRFFRMISI